MVLIGRPFNFAAAAGGERGVRHAIALLRSEVDRNLAMLGFRSCAQLDERCVTRLTPSERKR